jgi:hypothetical protein
MAQTGVPHQVEVYPTSAPDRRRTFYGERGVMPWVHRWCTNHSCISLSFFLALCLHAPDPLHPTTSTRTC